MIRSDEWAVCVDNYVLNGCIRVSLKIWKEGVKDSILDVQSKGESQ